MEPGQTAQFQYILDYLSIGITVLEASNLRVRYINPYLRHLLQEAWGDQPIIGRRIDEVVPEKISTLIFPLLQHVAQTGESVRRQEIPFEGFLERRGRTYWSVSIERSPLPNQSQDQQAMPDSITPEPGERTLFVTIEDVTNTVRSRLHLNAIHHISSGIAGAYTLPQVLDRILDAVHDMVGSRRCAILLLDNLAVTAEERSFDSFDSEEVFRTIPAGPRYATVAAQKGLHPSSYSWHPQLSDHTLLGQVERERRPLIITNTRAYPHLELPLLDDQGMPRRPGSVLSVPIFEPYPPRGAEEDSAQTFSRRTRTAAHSNSILGGIEVYHFRSRGFPAEEVQLLEQFAQQAGLAIQNVRLFRRVEQWARLASRNAHQRQNIMRAIPDGVVIFDPRWRIADTNPVARQLFGWSDDILSRPLTEVIAQSPFLFPQTIIASPTPIAELEQRAYQGHIDEFKMIAANGQYYTMRCSYTPVRDELGDTFAFIVIYHDVTEQVVARERIEAEVVARTAELAQRNQALQLAKLAQDMQQARLELLLKRLPSGVMLVSAQDHSITIINRRAVQILQLMGLPLEPYDNIGVAAKRAIGMNSHDLLNQIITYGPSGAIIPYEESPLHLALTRGQATEAELHMPGKEGQMLFMLVNAAPLRAADGTVTSAVLVLHDITTIKHLERAREDFFTTMAHELKTPLANIRAHLSALLAKDLEWSLEEQHDFLQTADEQVERLVGMINHFLDASRVEAGALRLEREAILLPEMFEDLQERLEALITSSNRRLQISLPPHLPAVWGDYELLMSVLTNLLSNAFRYAPEGDTVYLEAEPVFADQENHPSSVTLCVTDHGPGITQEQQAELFTRFSTFAAMSRPAIDRPGQPAAERRRGTARWSPATGLGLYISRGIIEAHGSTLQLKSSPGQGASFSFTLPAFKEQPEQNGTTDQAAMV
jgi:PAS domain S-box-containing protein